VRRQRKARRVPSTFKDITPEFHTFERAVLEEVKAANLPPESQVPDELFERVVMKLYGGWTPDAVRHFQELERRLGIPAEKRRRF
jgi:hypothetical protein